MTERAGRMSELEAFSLDDSSSREQLRSLTRLTAEIESSRAQLSQTANIDGTAFQPFDVEQARTMIRSMGIEQDVTDLREIVRSHRARTRPLQREAIQPLPGTIYADVHADIFRGLADLAGAAIYRPIVDDGHDEEFIPPSGPGPGDFDHLANRGEAQPGANFSRIKKVITREAFNRLCQPLTVDQPSTFPQDWVEDKEDDSEGGPQDAGLGLCGVCLALLVSRSRPVTELRGTPTCSHKFHAECLLQWLTQNAITCPTCREPVVTDKREYGVIDPGINEGRYTAMSDFQESRRRPRTRAPEVWTPFTTRVPPNGLWSA